MSLSWEWRRALSTVLAVWLLLSLWKSRLQLSMTPSRAVPFHSGMQMVEDVRQGGSPSSARWSADAASSNRDSAGALPSERPRGWPQFARDNASHPLAPMVPRCTGCEPFCKATHAEFHCRLRKCCACPFCLAAASAQPRRCRRSSSQARWGGGGRAQRDSEHAKQQRAFAGGRPPAQRGPGRAHREQRVTTLQGHGTCVAIVRV